MDLGGEDGFPPASGAAVHQPSFLPASPSAIMYQHGEPPAQGHLALFFGGGPGSAPWVPAGRGRSRSPPTTVNGRVTQLEERLKGLEQNPNELLSERAWWTWWYNHWGKWLQNTVVRLNNAIMTFTDAWSAMARRADPDPATDQSM